MLDEVIRGLDEVLKEDARFSVLHGFVLSNGILFTKRSLNPSSLFSPAFAVIWCENEGRIPSYTETCGLRNQS